MDVKRTAMPTPFGDCKNISCLQTWNCETEFHHQSDRGEAYAQQGHHIRGLNIHF